MRDAQSSEERGGQQTGNTGTYSSLLFIVLLRASGGPWVLPLVLPFGATVDVALLPLGPVWGEGTGRGQG